MLCFQFLPLTKPNFLLTLLGNPNLLEHNHFTDLLRTLFHLTEEWEWRRNFVDIQAEDRAHYISYFEKNSFFRYYQVILIIKRVPERV